MNRSARASDLWHMHIQLVHIQNEPRVGLSVASWSYELDVCPLPGALADIESSPLACPSL
eukprot:COSAG02_NODE_2361_length_9063_cov_3.936859_3_plen_60_part_00